MDSSRTNTPMGNNGVDTSAWDDIYASQFADEAMNGEETFGNSAFNDFTNFGSYAGDSPLGLSLRTPSKSDQGNFANASSQLSHAAQFAPSAESSSQDSASDSSSRRKRKTNDSESPVSDPATEVGKRDVQVKQEDVHMGMGEMHQVRSFDNTFSQPMHNLSLGQRMSRGDGNISQFGFNSAASSPIQARDFNSAMSLDAHMNMPASAGAAQYNQGSPVATINPGMFTIGASRDQSPVTNNMMFNQASTSPHAIFSTPSSDSPDTFSNNQTWNPSLNQNPTWSNDYTGQLTSPGAMGYTPSPGANGATPGTSRAAPVFQGRSRLHIAPISTKSRVETQINVIMTLERPPPGVEQLHLPLHTIAKSKLLAKEEYQKHTVLELHTMLVCSSTMHNAQTKEKALKRAAAASNDEIQARAESARDTGDEEKNDPKNVPEDEKPANGGEVRICSNCIQRERKRAGRKKTKREEEQQHWERFETERVVVFNSNEYLQFKPCDPGPQPTKDDSEPYIPPDGAIQATAAMRIACYCRHQSEKEGFQVIFTMKDHHGNVVAQEMSDSILITDDHKTHPQSFSATVPSDGFYATTFLPNGLPMSQSMIDMPSHLPTFPSSRSAGNLQALQQQFQPFNPHSHVHQVTNPGFASQTTSATMTPTSLSRPGSPTNSGNSGPNKKRKSASFHRKVPSGLTMTPRVDTSQPPSSNMPSAVSMNSQFSPSFPNMNQPYMTMPANAGAAHYYNTSGPPTPSESSSGFQFNQSQVDMSRMNNQAYFSHPSSAVPSRASSPVLTQARGNMAAYARQPQPIQTPTNSLPGRQSMFATGQIQQQPPPANDVPRGPLPLITRVTPAEGPAIGGNEVAVLGENFVPGIAVAFGDQIGATTYLSPNSLIVTAPIGRPGGVYMNLFSPGSVQTPSKTVYTYSQTQEDMMVMALKYLSEQQFGNPDGWQNFAKQSATNFLQSRVGRAGLPGQQQQQGGQQGHG